MSDTAVATVVVSAPSTPDVVVTPPTAAIVEGTTVQFSANGPVTWSVQEGDAGGTIDATGLYRAPGVPGTFHVIATAVVVPPPPITVTIAPQSASLGAGQTTTFAASASSGDVVLSILEGAAGGSITPAGLYTAPAVAGTYHVVATSVLDPTKAASAAVAVAVAPPANVGVWTNVTPDGKGFCDVVVDPVRPQDLYAFSSLGGVYKSTDFGQTWVKINTGAGQAQLDAGNHWASGIDPNPSRDPNTPPKLWTCNGQSANLGVWRSLNGGVDWTHSRPNNQLVAAIAGNQAYRDDAYSIDVDPGNANHLIIGFHGFAGMSESFDAGVTWHSIVVPLPSTQAPGIGDSLYPFFIDPSPAEVAAGATVSSTWLTQAQWGNTGQGLWRTIDSGATWTRVCTMEHAHGGAQLVKLPNGLLYVGGYPGPSGSPTNAQGVMRSTDYGKTWTSVYTAKPLTGMVATPTKLYAGNGFAGVTNPNLVSALRSADTAWTATPNVPAGITTGWKRAAVTFDGAHQIIVGAFRQSGIWRYIEP